MGSPRHPLRDDPRSTTQSLHAAAYMCKAMAKPAVKSALDLHCLIGPSSCPCNLLQIPLLRGGPLPLFYHDGGSHVISSGFSERGSLTPGSKVAEAYHMSSRDSISFESPSSTIGPVIEDLACKINFTSSTGPLEKSAVFLLEIDLQPRCRRAVFSHHLLWWYIPKAFLGCRMMDNCVFILVRCVGPS